MDTCKTCDGFEAQMNSLILSFERKEMLKHQKENHLQIVIRTKEIFESDIQRARNSEGKVRCLTFDLQKALETPVLSTSIAYYKRQLWTYNLCVYDEAEKVAYMYIWDAGVASRGAQEIGSCLLYHLKNSIDSNCEHVILYSDSCGGQNRNIKMTLMLKKFLSNTASNIQTIEQKFFVSGHSFNSCDRCFGLIEKQKSKMQEIYVPQHWVNTIVQAKKREPKFKVIEMTSVDFFSTKNLENSIVNRKKTIEGAKLNWLETRNIINRKTETLTLNFKSDFDGTEQQANLSKKLSTENLFVNSDLEPLFRNGRPITTAKFNDLMELIKYIPMKYHDFYKGLKCEQTDNDYGLASGCSDSDSE